MWQQIKACNLASWSRSANHGKKAWEPIAMVYIIHSMKVPTSRWSLKVIQWSMMHIHIYFFLHKTPYFSSWTPQLECQIYSSNQEMHMLLPKGSNLMPFEKCLIITIIFWFVLNSQIKWIIKSKLHHNSKSHD